VEREDLQSAHQAFDIIFELDQIDDGNRDTLFFADEGGSWPQCRAVVPWAEVPEPTLLCPNCGRHVEAETLSVGCSTRLSPTGKEGQATRLLRTEI